MRRLASGMVSGLPLYVMAAPAMGSDTSLRRARAMRLLQQRRVSLARRRGVRPASPTACLPSGGAIRGGASDHSDRQSDGSVSSGRVRTRNASGCKTLAKAVFSGRGIGGQGQPIAGSYGLDNTRPRRPRPREQRFHASRAAARASPRRAASPKQDDGRRGEHQQRRIDFGVV